MIGYYREGTYYQGTSPENFKSVRVQQIETVWIIEDEAGITRKLTPDIWDKLWPPLVNITFTAIEQPPFYQTNIHPSGSR